jgi:hypothetical protein
MTVHDEDDDYDDNDHDDDPSLVVSSATARKIKDKLRKKINRLADKCRRKSVSFPADLLPAEDQEPDQEQDEEFFYDLEVDEKEVRMPELLRLITRGYVPKYPLEEHPDMIGTGKKITDEYFKPKWYHCPMCHECGPFTEQCKNNENCKQCERESD